MFKLISYSPEETMDFAIKYAKKLKGGEILALRGDLGSGKTTFTKGLAEGLKISETITSPTFVMLKEYSILRPLIHLVGVSKGLGKFIHIDAYRAETIEDIKSVGIEDYFKRSEKQGSAQAGSYLDRSDVIMAIEWPEKIAKILPKNTIYINFKHLSENKREISLNSAGACLAGRQAGKRDKYR